MRADAARVLAPQFDAMLALCAQPFLQRGIAAPSTLAAESGCHCRAEQRDDRVGEVAAAMQLERGIESRRLRLRYGLSSYVCSSVLRSSGRKSRAQLGPGP